MAWSFLFDIVHHRGQITTMLRQIGAEPAKPMDLIAYYRVQAVKS